MMSSTISISEIFILKALGSYVQNVTMKYIKKLSHQSKTSKKKKKTKDYDILPEEVEEEYYVWVW